MSNSLYVTCEYCGSKTIRTSHRQKYCNLTCNNRMQYERYKARSKVKNVSNTVDIRTIEVKGAEQTEVQYIDVPQDPGVDTGKASEDFLSSFKAANVAEGPPLPDPQASQSSTKIARPTVITKEQAEAESKKVEEDRLLARYRAKKKRERLLAKAKLELGVSEETTTDKTKEELRNALSSRWIEAMKKGEPDV